MEGTAVSPGRRLLAPFLLCIFLASLGNAARRRGQWNAEEEQVKLVAKFGFQQTSSLDKKGSRGFVYGNVTSSNFVNGSKPFLLAIVPYAQYESFRIQPQSEYRPSCSILMQNISAVAYESRCFKDGTRGDYFRWVPCPEDELCKEEDDPTIVLPGSQLTMQIEEPKIAEYWYVLLIACDLDDQCAWESTTSKAIVDYDIWLTNGHPLGSFAGPFTLQFSFDEQDTAQIYLLALVVQIAFCGGIVRAKILYKKHMPHRVQMLSAVIVMKTVGVFLQSVNAIIYATNGEGIYIFRFFGEMLMVTSVDTLCLLLILIARGWGVAMRDQALSKTTLVMWIILTGVDHVLFLLNIIFVYDLPHQADIFHSWPGYGMLCIRILFALWFLTEVRGLIASAKNDEKETFFAHFGAGFLVWFVYIFGLGVVATSVSSLWRFRIILAIRNLANCSAIAILLHLFWPTSTNRKFFDGDTSLSGRLRVDSSDLYDMDELLLNESDSEDDLLGWNSMHRL